MTPKKRILIVDDHPMLRMGLRNLLEGSGRFIVSGEAASPSLALREIERHNMDCAIVDMMFKGRKRLDLVSAVRKQLPEIPIIVLSMLARAEAESDAIKSGATVFLSKDESPTRVLEVLEDLFPAEDPNELNGHLPLSSLTPRERSIFELLGTGLDKHDITKILGISVKTVETHRESLKRKLNAPSIRDLVRLAVQVRQNN